MARKTVFVAEINRHELAMRIAEGCLDMKRPAGIDPAKELAKMRAQGPAQRDTIDGWYRAADRAAQYLTECVSNGRQPS